jgi:hypothetical protein
MSTLLIIFGTVSLLVWILSQIIRYNQYTNLVLPGVTLYAKRDYGAIVRGQAVQVESVYRDDLKFSGILGTYSIGAFGFEPIASGKKLTLKNINF